MDKKEYSKPIIVELTSTETEGMGTGKASVGPESNVGGVMQSTS